MNNMMSMMNPDMMNQMGSGLFGQPSTNQMMQMPDMTQGGMAGAAPGGGGLGGLMGNPMFGMGMGLLGGFQGLGQRKSRNPMQDMMQGMMTGSALQRGGLYGQQ